MQVENGATPKQRAPAPERTLFRATLPSVTTLLNALEALPISRKANLTIDITAAGIAFTSYHSSSFTAKAVIPSGAFDPYVALKNINLSVNSYELLHSLHVLMPSGSAAGAPSSAPRGLGVSVDITYDCDGGNFELVLQPPDSPHSTLIVLRTFMRSQDDIEREAAFGVELSALHSSSSAATPAAAAAVTGTGAGADMTDTDAAAAAADAALQAVVTASLRPGPLREAILDVEFQCQSRDVTIAATNAPGEPFLSFTAVDLTGTRRIEYPPDAHSVQGQAVCARFDCARPVANAYLLDDMKLVARGLSRAADVQCAIAGGGVLSLRLDLKEAGAGAEAADAAAGARGRGRRGGRSAARGGAGAATAAATTGAYVEAARISVGYYMRAQDQGAVI